MSRRDVGTRHLKTTVRNTMLCLVVPSLLLSAGCRWRHGAPEGSPGQATERSARAAGGQITHSGRCGACSSFQDLAVYIEQKDLNRAGRLCGLRGTLGSKGQLSCFKKLGFTEACAQIWSFNVDHTRSECMGSCMATIPTKHKRPDGSLNPCLACDEENSGPVFKAVAGRTRRSSGLTSAIARPCLDAQGEPAVYPVEHYYFSQRSSRARN